MSQSYQVLDFIPMGAFVLDSDFRVKFWNKCMELWTSLKAQDMLGQDIRKKFPQLAQPKIASRLEDIFNGGPPTIFSAQLHRYIIPAPLPGGRNRLQNTLVNAMHTDQGYLALFTLQDVTEISRRLEQYIAMRNHALSEVEERRKAEREIREREAMYRSIFEKMRAVKLIIDPSTGAVVDANTAACYFYGYPYPQMLRMNINEINALPQESLLDYMRLAVSEEDNIFEFRHRLANGELRDVEVHSAPIEFHGQTLLYSIIHDITERKRVEKALRLSESKFRLLFDMAVDVITLVDKNGVILDISQAVTDLLGYDKEELLGRRTLELHSAPDEAQYLARIRSVLQSSEPVAFESELKTKSGEFLPVGVHSRSIEIEGAPALLSISRDISARRKMEALREDVEHITRHDLKNPLSAMLGLPELLMQSGDLNDEQRDIVRIIQNAGYTMLNMINRSLDLYKIETGNYPFKASPVDILRLLERILSESGELLRAKSMNTEVRFENQGGESRDATILGEGMLCYSMLSNLVSNAVEAAPDGGCLDIELRPENGFMRIAIHNDGMVPEDMQGCFFEKYTTSGKSGGTGLGTFSAKLMAEVQGGSIGFESSAEQGTVVWVELPCP